VTPALRTAYEEELLAARRDLAGGDWSSAFSRLERAHVLGQRSTRAHVRAHWAMLRIGWHRRDTREVLGQISRLLGALLFSRIWVPVGNTGGANVSAFATMPIPEDLRRLLDGEP
jgi:hypothetical protein